MKSVNRGLRSFFYFFFLLLILFHCQSNSSLTDSQNQPKESLVNLSMNMEPDPTQSQVLVDESINMRFQVDNENVTEFGIDYEGDGDIDLKKHEFLRSRRYRYLEPGYYKVTAYVETKNGGYDSLSRKITIMTKQGELPPSSSSSKSSQQEISSSEDKSSLSSSISSSVSSSLVSSSTSSSSSLVSSSSSSSESSLSSSSSSKEEIIEVNSNKIEIPAGTYTIRTTGHEKSEGVIRIQSSTGGKVSVDLDIGSVQYEENDYYHSISNVENNTEGTLTIDKPCNLKYGY